MTSQCGGCGSAIEAGTLKCRRCGTEVSRKADERLGIQTGAFINGVGDKLKEGTGILGFLIHASAVLCLLPIFAWLILFPLICAFGLPDVPARYHARACLWFIVDCYIGYAVAVGLSIVAGLAVIVGAGIGGVIHFNNYRFGTRYSYVVGMSVIYIAIGLLSVTIAIRCISHVFKAAAVARDGGWYTYPVLFVSRARTAQF